MDDLNYLACSFSFWTYFGQSYSFFTSSLFIAVHFPNCKTTVFACNIRRLDKVITFSVCKVLNSLLYILVY